MRRAQHLWFLRVAWNYLLCARRTPTTTAASSSTRGWRCRLLQPGACASSHPSLNLLALRLQDRRSEEGDLLSLFESVQDFGVVKIAYSDAYRSRSEFAILFY